MTPNDRPARRILRAMTALAALAACAGGGRTTSAASPPAEPNAEIACGWWRDLRAIWTPIGWKDHFFRYNVFYDGRILAQPDLNARAAAWKGQGVQLQFVPTATGAFHGPAHQAGDDGMVRQGWREGAAPVLWSEWAHEGVLLRQDVFAHIPGGGDVETGVEPLFAWIRLSVAETCDSLPLEPRTGFAIKINAPHVIVGMSNQNNIAFPPEQSAYPRRLAPDADGDIPAVGWLLAEEDGKIRLGIAPGQRGHVAFVSGQPTKRDAVLSVLLETRGGAHVDLLLPMVPTERAVFDREMALGFEGARREADGYWSKAPSTAARVDTPEPLVNETIRHSLKFAEVIAERDPAQGDTSLLSGSLAYTALWATPHAMASVMLLDTMGHHGVVEKHLDIFRREQGTVKPPGDDFPVHPGYLSSPKSLTSIDWLSDHGALLYTISEHALLSGDRAFVERWRDAIVRACEFVRDARALPRKTGVAGILPPAVATDRGTRIQAVWNDGWNHKGLAAAARLLRQIGDPRAAEFEAEARAYREAYAKALREKAAAMPRWRDAEGRTHPFVPTALSGDRPDETRHAFYLDTGPLFLVYAGLLDADDELMRASLKWFREGPQTRLYRRDANCWQVPCLDHEMSSCEPCYSWNVFHPHQTGDRLRYLEGMYSLFAGAVSRQTFISCETRGGITGNIFAAPLAVYLARLAVVDDQVEPGTLHLLRLAPRAWLRTDRETAFERIPTEHGPVTIRFGLGAEGKALRVTYEPRFRTPPARVVLHVPPLPGLAGVDVNGTPVAWDGKAGSVVLEGGR